MSDTPDNPPLDALRDRQRLLNIELEAIRTRLAEVHECIQLVERSQRRRPGRPRNTALEVVAPPAPPPDDAA